MSHIESIEKFIPDLRERNILDLGCGSGDDLIEFARCGYKAIGLDMNKEHLIIAQNRAQEEGLQIEIYQGKAENLPFQNESFDFISCSEVTEHVEDPEMLLAECYRVLRHGGKMYISFHNRYGAYDHHYHLWFINWFPRAFVDTIITLVGKTKNDSGERGRQKLSEMHYWTYANVRALLKRYNFDCVDTRDEQIRNPQLSNRKILKICAKLKLSKIISFFAKKFIGTFHFVVTKN